jgi:hypothetical protein
MNYMDHMSQFSQGSSIFVLCPSQLSKSWRNVLDFNFLSRCAHTTFALRELFVLKQPYQYGLSLYTVVSKNRNKLNKWIRVVIDAVFPWQSAVPCDPNWSKLTGVSMQVSCFLTFPVKFVNVKMLKCMFVFSETLSKAFQFHYLFAMLFNIYDIPWGMEWYQWSSSDQDTQSCYSSSIFKYENWLIF